MEIVAIGDIGITVSEILMPTFVVLFSFVITLWIKDILTKVAKGLGFKLSGIFREGDRVILDNEPAIIVKIGITHTVFGITKEDNHYCWRYVPNERISHLKLEKLIFED